MAAVPIDPATISVRPAVLDAQGVRVGEVTDVACRFAGRHAGWLQECATAWAGQSAVALTQLSAHWEATDARLHARVSGLAAAMRDGGRHFMAMEDEHARMFAALTARGSGGS
ncbi:hypothetical protein [Mycolicibacter icosiumassiliensis]|uniref:hypothetical protein n=1 Tax=Mycolicibacter icosiumassiliensis TaxID=1792835 RepID=UPI000A5BA449|nr:hypothetical protein [Mycolicibacter icosiumassiliensis]